MSAEQLERLPAEIAASLLDIEAISLRPDDLYTWTSGIRSPIYCDNRLTMAYPQVRERIADAFVALIREKYDDVEVIAGTSTAGIPHAAWVAQKLGLPMAYIRDKPKGHGKKSQIEGIIEPGQKVIVIEDLISTGGSSLAAALAVIEAGGDVLGVLAIFTYEFADAATSFEEEGIVLETLSNYTALLEQAQARGAISEDQAALLAKFRDDPQTFGQ